MTLWEVEKFLNQTSDVPRSLADPWELNDVNFDAETLLNTIMIKGGELGPLFNNVATYYRQNMWWWKKWQSTFQKWWEAYDKDYEPLWDRNGYEESHDDITDTGYNNNVSSSTEVMDDDTTKTAHTVEVMDDDTTNSATATTNSTTNSTTTDTVSAYNDDEYSPEHRTTVSGTDASTTTTSGSGTDDRTTTTDYTESGTDDRTTTHNGTSDTDTGNDRDLDHTLHSWGNWGISQTSQKLLYAEFEVRFKVNPYELMSDIFIREMTDGVWV